MVTSKIKGVQFIAANTDADALSSSLAGHKIQLGPKLTKGHGSGANPDIGRRAAEESIGTVEEILRGTDMVFITAGMGKRHGYRRFSCYRKNCQTIGDTHGGVVTKPFMWEGKLKMSIAEEGIKALKPHTDVLIEIPNHKLVSIIDNEMLVTQTFEKSNEVLKRAVQSISDIITSKGLINVDFQDVKTIMQNAGEAMLSVSVKHPGMTVHQKATKMAVTSPLLDNVSIEAPQVFWLILPVTATTLKWKRSKKQCL